MKKIKSYSKSILFFALLTLFCNCEKEELNSENPESLKNINLTKSSTVSYISQNSFLQVRNDLSLWFKAGTQITFYNTGKVKQGVLLNNQLLLISGVGQRGSLNTKIWFKAGTKVTFDSNGNVSDGTLNNNSFIPIGWGNSGKKLWFQTGTEISFDYGTVSSGILLNNSFIQVTGYTKVWFRKLYRVDFDFYGNALSGVLVNLNSSPIGNGTTIWFRSWTEITYDGEIGFVRSGTLNAKTYLKLSFDNSNRWFDAGTFVELDNNGKVVDYFPY